MLPLLPTHVNTYCEPFVGGGALLFHLQPARAIINDVNAELINLYQVVKDDVEGLLEVLATFRNEAKTFYEVRAWDRDHAAYAQLSDIQKAARLLYLNKTCYNGLFRVNKAGEFNAPFGNYRNPNIVNAPVLRAVSTYLNSADIDMVTGGYAEILTGLPTGSFVYLDPPYDPVSDTASFTSYSKGGFGRQDQILLRKHCDDLDKRGIKFMLSNSATPFILEQYADYDVTIVKAKRAVNSIASKRGDIEEVVVRNYV